MSLQIKQILHFDDRKSFATVVKFFLGNHMADNNVYFVSNLFTEMGCRILVKVHMLHAHLNSSRKTLEHTQQNRESTFIETKILNLIKL